MLKKKPIINVVKLPYFNTKSTAFEMFDPQTNGRIALHIDDKDLAKYDYGKLLAKRFVEKYHKSTHILKSTNTDVDRNTAVSYTVKLGFADGTLTDKGFIRTFWVYASLVDIPKIVALIYRESHAYNKNARFQLISYNLDSNSYNIILSHMVPYFKDDDVYEYIDGLFSKVYNMTDPNSYM